TPTGPRAILSAMITKRMSPWFDDEVRALYDLAREFFEREVVAHVDTWDAQRHIDRQVWLEAGKLGLLLCSVPEEYGGGAAPSRTTWRCSTPRATPVTCRWASRCTAASCRTTSSSTARKSRSGNGFRRWRPARC